MNARNLALRSRQGLGQIPVQARACAVIIQLFCDALEVKDEVIKPPQSRICENRNKEANQPQ